METKKQEFTRKAADILDKDVYAWIPPGQKEKTEIPTIVVMDVLDSIKELGNNFMTNMISPTIIGEERNAHSVVAWAVMQKHEEPTTWLILLRHEIYADEFDDDAAIKKGVLPRGSCVTCGHPVHENETYEDKTENNCACAAGFSKNKI